MVIELTRKYYYSCGEENGKVLYSDKEYREDIPHHLFQKEFYKQYPGGAMTDMFYYWNAYLAGTSKAT